MVFFNLDLERPWKKEYRQKMNASPDMPETPPELADAWARIDQAKENYISLAREMNEFLYKYVKGMMKGRDRESGNFVLQLRHPKESNVKGKPRVLVAQIVENLRTALDYMIFELSVLNEPNLNERVPQFAIADNKSSFEGQAKKRLRYLTDEQKSFVEQIQPYHGNGTLALLRKLAGRGKHRRLLSIRDQTGFDIYFAEMAKKEEYKDCFVYPMEEGQAMFAKPKGRGVLVLIDKYDAMPTLKTMIEHAADIVRVSFCFFEGRPLKLSILKS